jgi:PAS domain S-box-containing protein
MPADSFNSDRNPPVGSKKDCRMNGTAMVAAHLDEQVDAIIAAWRNAVRRGGDVPQEASLTHQEFVDHIPALIDQMAARMRGEPSSVAAEGLNHGLMRWRQGYDVREVVAELGHLRSVLMQSTFQFARDRHFDLDALEAAHEAFNEVLNEAAANAVSQFQDESRAQTASALALVDSRREAVEDARLTAETERIKLQTVLENLPIGVWVMDREGRMVSVNREGERLQDFPATDIVGAPRIKDLRAHYPIERPDGTAYRHEDFPLLRALRGESVVQEEFRWKLPSVTRNVLASAAPLTKPDGSIIGAVVVIQDMTEQKRLEARLAASEARFRGIAERSPALIWRADVDGRHDFFNQSWLDFRGRPTELEIGDGWLEGIHADDRERCRSFYQNAFSRREPFEMLYRLQRWDGQFRWIIDRGAPYFEVEDRFLGYLGGCVDITERIDLEAALQRQRELAERSSLHKTRLISTLSHDARTPLNAVSLSAQLLEMHIGQTPDVEVRECLRTIRDSVANLLDLLSDMLDLTKLDAGAASAEMSQFAIEPVLSESLSTIEGQARQKGLITRIDAGSLAGKALQTDRSKLKQILGNLLSNALRYTDHGQIRLFGDLKDDYLEIGVEDTGPGISAGNQDRIFEEFARIDRGRRDPGEGTGLGLAISRRLANLLGGEIRLSSRPGEGSRFTIVLPASILTTLTPDAPDASTRGGPGGGTILVVEDNEASRRALCRLLRLLGYHVVEAENGREAIDLATAEQPLAVLMDVNMPEMDGIEATATLRARPLFRDLPIFALTGDVTNENRRRIAEAGVNGFLEKPVSPDALLKTLGKILRPTTRGLAD